MASQNKSLAVQLYKETFKSNIPQSTKNKHWFKILALFIYKLIVDNNTNKLGNEIGKKKPISKRGVCIYMAQHNKEFRTYYLYWKATGRKRSDKHYPKSMEERKKIGLDFYHNVVTDKRKNKEIDTLYVAFKKANRGKRQFYIKVSDGPVGKRKFTKKIIK